MSVNTVQSSLEGLSDSSKSDKEFPISVERVLNQDLAVSDFSLVIFPGISDYFPPRKDVRVTYVLTESMEPSSRDWIGLFKVGWSSAREYITFVWSPKTCLPKGNEHSVVVTFSAYYLPTDQIEFYQFCYVSKRGNIRGASTPFQFRESSSLDQLVEVEDETGMIVLKTKSLALEEQLDSLNNLKDNLEQRLQELIECNDKLSAALADSTCQLKASKLEASAKDKEYEKLKEELADCTQSNLDANSNLEGSRQTVVVLEEALHEAQLSVSNVEKGNHELREQLAQADLKHRNEMVSLNKKIDDKTRKIVELECSVQNLTTNLESARLKDDEMQLSNIELQRELDEVKAYIVKLKEEKDQLSHLEEARHRIMQQLLLLQQNLHCKDAENQEQLSKILVHEEKARILENELKNVSQRALVQKSTLESQLSNIEDEFNASEASKRLISDELTEARDHRDKLMSELHLLKKDKDEVSMKLALSMRQFAELQNDHFLLKERSEARGQQLAENEAKLSKAEVETRECERACKILTGNELETKDNIIRDLRLQIEDLHTRLTMGAAAYTEKYTECHRLERRLKKLQSKKPPNITISKAESCKTDSMSMTSDSQEESTKSPKTSSESKPYDDVVTEGSVGLSNPQDTGKNFMAKLEKIFMAIADPDIAEQEQSNQLRARLEKMEKSFQCKHSKYRKYKKLYQEERASQARGDSKFKAETLSLKTVVNDLRSNMKLVEHENKVLKEQLKEIVTDCVVETAHGISTPPTGASTKRLGNSLPEDFSNCYTHDILLSSPEAHSKKSCENNFNGAFGWPGAKFSPLQLRPKDHKSNSFDETCSPVGLVIPSPGVIQRQPTRSPPLIEVISCDEDGHHSVPSVFSSTSSYHNQTHQNQE